MPSEVIRCTDCGATFKAVPSWLVGAKVKFTCTNCPKRPSRAIARFEPAPVVMAAHDTDDDIDNAGDEMDEDADLELSSDEMDDIKDDKDN